MSSTLNLPIESDTTTDDIKSAAASLIPRDADFTTSVVVECVVAQGLERRLRGFENVRDVMNSWGPFHENFLRIDRRSTSAFRQEVAGVPPIDAPLTDSSFLLQHALCPKEWKACWVTLRADGHLFAANRDNYSPDNAALLCHLSMFDIYTSSGQEFKHRRDTPAKFCYALKSQNKTRVSCVDRETVHFFCTEDEALADRFYQLIHRWRSWYLVKQKIHIVSRQSISEEHGALG